MEMRKGKLFQNVETREIKVFPYDGVENYYTFIKETQDKGFRQSIITSDIMISLSEFLLLYNKCAITFIDFFIEDEDLQSEIKPILEKMSKDRAYWAILKEKLEFLQKKESIEIKKVEFKEMTPQGAMISVFVNGILSISDIGYDSFAEKVSKHVEGCLH